MLQMYLLFKYKCIKVLFNINSLFCSYFQSKNAHLKEDISRGIPDVSDLNELLNVTLPQAEIFTEDKTHEVKEPHGKAPIDNECLPGNESAKQTDCEQDNVKEASDKDSDIVEEDFSIKPEASNDCKVCTEEETNHDVIDDAKETELDDSQNEDSSAYETATEPSAHSIQESLSGGTDVYQTAHSDVDQCGDLQQENIEGLVDTQLVANKDTDNAADVGQHDDLQVQQDTIEGTVDTENKHLAIKDNGKVADTGKLYPDLSQQLEQFMQESNEVR